MLRIFFKTHRLLLVLIALQLLGLRAFGQDCSTVASDQREATVSLFVERTIKQTGAVISGAGTGFIVSKDGYVLTAYHVVAANPDNDDVKISGSVGSLYGSRVELRIVDKLQDRDIALLQFLDTSKDYRPVPLADPGNVVAGRQLCSLSYSSPLNSDYHVSTGPLRARTGQKNNWWTTQMPSNHGESGAPVFDISAGGVVAIVEGGYDDQLIGQNLNYVIPLNLARSFLLDWVNIIVPSASSSAQPASPSYPVHFFQNDNFGGFHMITNLTVSGNGRVDAVTETNNHVALKGNCGRVAVWLIGKDGGVLTSPQGGQRFCVDGTRVLWGASVRKDNWSFIVAADVLKKVANVGILQTEDNKDPADISKENLDQVKRVFKSTTRQ